MKEKVMMDALTGRILSDVRVELAEEFDRNFKREAFFSEGWERRRSPVRGTRSGHLLVDSGDLRRSIGSKVEGDSLTFYSTLPYASLHNDGGEIVVTERMKKYFWHRYLSVTGALAFSRRKDGRLRGDKVTQRLQGEAAFWKYMALKKAGSAIRIPRRRFLGNSAEVERIVRDVIAEDLDEYFGGAGGRNVLAGF